MITALPNPDDDRRRDASALLRQLADELDSGEALHVIGVIHYPGGEYSTFRTRTVSRHEMVGIIFDAIGKIVPPSDHD